MTRIGGGGSGRHFLLCRGWMRGCHPGHVVQEVPGLRSKALLLSWLALCFCDCFQGNPKACTLQASSQAPHWPFGFPGRLRFSLHFGLDLFLQHQRLPLTFWQGRSCPGDEGPSHRKRPLP